MIEEINFPYTPSFILYPPSSILYALSSMEGMAA
jgi:hypothetical protein